MSGKRRIKAPNTQKRLTNIVVVRLHREGIRFEVACYPNKVEEWRRKVETDLDEVLQRQVVFLNVSKGEVARDDELQNSFGTTEQEKICRIILESGQIQVSEKERKQDNEKLFKDIASLIVEKCINAETKQTFPLGVIENAMREIHVSINPHKSAKQQALKIIPLLQEKSSLPIERAKMKLLLSVPKEQIDPTKEKLKDLIEIILQTEENNRGILTIVIEPKNYRQVDTIAKESSGNIEVLQHSIKPDGDDNF